MLPLRDFAARTSSASGGTGSRIALTALVRHELALALRRPALWLAYGLLFVFHTVLLFSPPPVGEWVAGEVIPSHELWSVAGRFLAALNVFFPVVVGILSADRMARDVRLGLRELQLSTPLEPGVYVLAKYLGNVVACLLPLFLWAMGIAVVMTVTGHTTPLFLYAVPVAFLAISVPAVSFVVAFSLACPLFMPLSVYQILFTGYWFWANFVPPALFPTLNGTWLTPSGVFALRGFFNGPVSVAVTGAAPIGPLDAIANLTVLAALVAAVLLLLTHHLRRQAQQA